MTWQYNIQRILKERKLKIKDLAAMLGVTPASVSNMLRADARISSLEAVAHALGVTPAELLTREDERKARESAAPPYDEEYRATHVHGYLRIGERVVEINSMDELREAVVACDVNHLK